MSDWTNSAHIHSDDVLCGTFYLVRPKTTSDEGIRFEYDIVNERDTNYAMLIETLKTDKAICTIKTSDLLNYKVGAYMRLQDGGLWQIQGFVKHLISKRKQALRHVKQTIDTEWVVRLIEVENPMNLL